MKTRERICKYYTYKDGPCDKRGVSVSFRNECQKCKFYDPLPGARPARTDNRKKKLDKIFKKEKWDG